MRLTRVGATGAAIVLVHALVGAQPPEATLSFEVASVKANRSGSARTDASHSGDRVAFINETLRRLIGEAYGTTQPLPPFQILGGPDWIDSDRFDVIAKAQGVPTSDERRAMLRSLLAERFKFTAHYATQERPIYNLVTVRADKTLGPNLRRSSVDCAAPVAAGQPRPCVIRFARGQLSANGMTVAQLAGLALSRQVRRVVVDRTGLEGIYDWNLEWSPDGVSPGASAGRDRPSIFTALQEQLGLKLEPAQGPVVVLVIDRVEQPTPD